MATAVETGAFEPEVTEDEAMRHSGLRPSLAPDDGTARCGRWPPFRLKEPNTTKCGRSVSIER